VKPNSKPPGIAQTIRKKILLNSLQVDENVVVEPWANWRIDGLKRRKQKEEKKGKDHSSNICWVFVTRYRG
jgi:hypothetical protein